MLLSPAVIGRIVCVCECEQIYMFPFNRNINGKAMKSALLIGCIVHNARRVHHTTPHTLA